MISCIGWSLEMMAILLCIHILYGKKFRLNIKNITVIVVDIILLLFIAEEWLERTIPNFMKVNIFMQFTGK